MTGSTTTAVILWSEKAAKSPAKQKAAKSPAKQKAAKSPAKQKAAKSPAKQKAAKSPAKQKSGKEYQRSRAEQTREALGKNLRRVFRPRLKQWLSATEREIENNGGKYLLLTEDTDIALYLDFLNTHLRFVS